MPSNVFGTPVTDQTDINARNYVENLKKQSGYGVSTLCLVYNATGDTIRLVGMATLGAPHTQHRLQMGSGVPFCMSSKPVVWLLVDRLRLLRIAVRTTMVITVTGCWGGGTRGMDHFPPLVLTRSILRSAKLATMSRPEFGPESIIVWLALWHLEWMLLNYIIWLFHFPDS
ncbi:hypothetical protein L3X38_009225 [Prunus dulcis]|uniref:Uncharacterized protein n=1 Tax=Prunus dulcis TaxID=3755 RepID=A0AAD5F808_PRUDU|nr:hypothetical protein L3X38_009225 [Prunus dulcis]